MVLALRGTLAGPLDTTLAYQGHLIADDQPANGVFDLRFTLCDAPNGGDIVAALQTNAAVVISNGLFTAALDFGSDAFTGAARWLEIAVRTNGADVFATLAPRQSIAPVPYAIYAARVNTAGLATAAAVIAATNPIPAWIEAATRGLTEAGGGVTEADLRAATGGLASNPTPFSLVCVGDSLTQGVNFLGAAQVETVAWRYSWTVASLVPNCTNVTLLAQGGKEAGYIRRNLFEPNLSVCTNSFVAFWVGNNFSTTNEVLTNLSAMVGQLGHGNYLVLSALHCTNFPPDTIIGNAVTALNGQLAATYGARFLDVNAALQAAATTNAADQAWIAQDFVPSSLLSDYIHLTAPGYQLVGTNVAAALARWSASRNPLFNAVLAAERPLIESLSAQAAQKAVALNNLNNVQQQPARTWTFSAAQLYPTMGNCVGGAQDWTLDRCAQFNGPALGFLPALVATTNCAAALNIPLPSDCASNILITATVGKHRWNTNAGLAVLRVLYYVETGTGVGGTLLTREPPGSINHGSGMPIVCEFSSSASGLFTFGTNCWNTATALPGDCVRRLVIDRSCLANSSAWAGLPAETYADDLCLWYVKVTEVK